VTGEQVGYVIGHFVPGAIIGLALRWFRPAWGWTPFAVAMVVSVAIIVVQKL
jgi:hypothetical protein